MKKQTFSEYLFSLLFFLVLSSCRTDFEPNEDFTGFVQKGPFSIGSRVTIEELSNNLESTGIIFETVTQNELGEFLLPTAVSKKYIKIFGEGFFFDENLGQASRSTLLLRNISFIGDQSGINVNVLTSLYFERLLYLVQDEGMKYESAKEQAKQETLQIFNIDFNAIDDFENLSVTEDGDGNAILLAISAIMTKYKNPEAITELLNSIAFDLREDGELNDQILQKEVFDAAVALKPSDIRQNMRRYENLGTIPSFENYAKRLIDPEFIDLPIDLSSDLLFHFNADNGTEDLSGNGNSLVIESVGVTENRNEKPNSAYSISRDASPHIQLPSNLDLWVPNWTFSIWARIDAMGDWDEATLLSNQHEIGNFEDSYFVVNSVQISSDYEHFAETGIFHSKNRFSRSRNYIENGVWYHYILTFEKGEILLYINGELSQVSRTDFTIEHPSNLPYEVIKKGRPSRQFDGAVSDIRFYRRVLNLAECKELYLSEK